MHCTMGKILLTLITVDTLNLNLQELLGIFKKRMI